MSQDDQRHQLDMDRFAEGFTEDGTVHHIVPSNSPLGQAMAEARERGIPDDPLDITGWKGDPVDE